MAGVGKTSLAVHVAHLLASRYPDAQLFIDLRAHTPGCEPLSPMTALETLLRALGVPDEQIPAQMEERAGLWRAELASRKAIVILDDAAEAAQVRPLLPGTAECLTLITSRRRLADLDTHDSLSLDVMSPQDALVLFRSTVGATRVAAAPEAAEEVLRLCGYLPLAIRIAGARLRARPSWTVGDIAQRLRDAQGRLAELSIGDRNVAAAFTVSYQHLDPRSRRLFRFLGLLRGSSFDAHTSAAIAGLPVDSTEPLLEDLVDVHLLDQPSAGRYRFHNLVQAYAASRAAAEDDEASRDGALRRLFGFYLHTAANADAPLRAADALGPAARRRRSVPARVCGPLTGAGLDER